MPKSLLRNCYNLFIYNNLVQRMVYHLYYDAVCNAIECVCLRETLTLF
jgi:hypothetical protein